MIASSASCQCLSYVLLIRESVQQGLHFTEKRNIRDYFCEGCKSYISCCFKTNDFQGTT